MTAALALMLAAGAGAAEFHARVVAVGDGDTLTLVDAEHRLHKVRLSAIDAPERRQAYGERAKQHLAALAHGKTVLVVGSRRDRYRRLIARVLLPECARPGCAYTVDLGLEQIRVGLAWHYTQYARAQPPAERLRYAGVEQQARIRREGLWKESLPTPPWQYRKPGSDPVFSKTRVRPAFISGSDPDLFAGLSRVLGFT
jgi:endonuclease YncB( thermonuclease family)